MIEVAKAVIGHPYLLGAKWKHGEWPAPNAPVDCSGLWTWALSMALARYPVDMIGTPAGPVPTHAFLARFEGSANQGALCREVSKLATLGPTGRGIFLLMRPGPDRHGHIAMSLGWGRTIESRGSKGVCIVKAVENLRRWNGPNCYAGKIDALFELVEEA
jgi:cell wall-associated NlpC family hydrolase